MGAKLVTMSQQTYTTKSIFSFIKQALKGDEHMDYTTGSIRRAVFMLAIPMILEMSMESVFALVDLFFVGHLHNSQHTLQTVSLTESVLINNLCTGNWNKHGSNSSCSKTYWRKKS